MPTLIDPRADVVTMVNIFDVPVENADEALRFLLDSTVEDIRHMPGFRSANFHLSTDRTRMINWAQWDSSEQWQAMREGAIGSAEIAHIKTLATPSPKLFRVIATVAPEGQDAPFAISETSEGAVTEITKYDIEPGEGELLAAGILSDAESRVRTAPGFRGAAVLVSLDGSRVYDYVQWDSAEAADAVAREQHPGAERKLYEVAQTFEPGSGVGPV